jgi:hypothetical protein
MAHRTLPFVPATLIDVAETKVTERVYEFAVPSVVIIRNVDDLPPLMTAEEE